MNNLFRKPSVPEIENQYKKYGFSQNPFPVDPTVKPRSEDRRENGSIFLEKLRTPEYTEFSSQIINSSTRIGFLMDYAAYKGRGIGKTAFLNYAKNKINHDLGDEISEGKEVLYAVYVMPSPDKKERSMPLIARNIYKAMLESDLFLITFCRLRAFSGQISDDLLSTIKQDSYEETIANDEWLESNGVDVLNLNREVNQILANIDIALDSASLFSSDTYKIFIDKLKGFDIDSFWKKEGCDFLFTKIARLLKYALFTHCVILLDEVEKIVTYQNFAERRAFCDSLRYYFIDGTSYNAINSIYKVLMTIHPNSQELLMPHWNAAGLDRFSVLGGSAANANTIFFNPIKDSTNMSADLALIYMNDVRDKSSDELYPFTKEALNAVMLQAENIPGKFLKFMNNAVELGLKNGWEIIDTAQVQSMWSTPKENIANQKDIILPETKVEL